MTSSSELHTEDSGTICGRTVTTIASAHANIVDRVGLGLYFMNDHNGNTKMNSFNLSAAYHIPIGDKKKRQLGQFSFGTSLSFAGMHFTGETELPNDPVYNDMETRVYIPYINFGASATYDGWMIGLSALDIPLSYNNPIVNQYEPSPTFYYGMLAKPSICLHSLNWSRWLPTVQTLTKTAVLMEI